MRTLGTIKNEEFSCTISEDGGEGVGVVADADIDANGQNSFTSAYKVDDSGRVLTKTFKKHSILRISVLAGSALFAYIVPHITYAESSLIPYLDISQDDQKKYAIVSDGELSNKTWE